jgi:hypothetical protein
VEFIAAGANFAAEVKAFVEQGQGAPFGALVVLVVAHEASI